jgi:diguanylate cyclase (GGDEF)-like protein/putative nucleotidyltransferase with HDIG domain
LGKLLNLTDSELEALKAGSLLHDIGKLGVPDHILNEPGPLGEAERERMKMHTLIGAQILERVNFPYPVVPVVKHHHEWWDGNGYPDKLKGSEIPLTARILAVVDCFDSVREDRPHRRGMSRKDALAILLSGSGTQFDPNIIELFLQNLPRFETEIAALGIEQNTHNKSNDNNAVINSDSLSSLIPENNLPNHTEAPAYLEQIKNAQREVYAFYQIARNFSSSLDIEDTLAILMNKIGNVVPFCTCVIYLYDEKKNIACATRVAGKNTEALRNHTVVPGVGFIGSVLADRHLRSESLANKESCEINELSDHLYKATAVLPLLKEQRLLGALAVYSTQLDEYSAEHLRLLNTIAKLASDALANALHHAEVETTALTDALTGLPNARSMYLNFEQEVVRSLELNQLFHVFMLDLDGFKAVNDTFGHKIGDRWLREVAGVIKKQLRDNDFLARYAGDEFVAIVHGLTNVKAEELCERIETAVLNYALNVRHGIHARVGVSVGAALFKSDGDTLDQLLIAADQAMYCVKSEHHKKRNQANIIEPNELVESFDSENLHSSTIN